MVGYVIKHNDCYIKNAPNTVTPSGDGGLMFAKYFATRQCAYNYMLQYMYCNCCRPIKLHEYEIVKVLLEEIAQGE